MTSIANHHRLSRCGRLNGKRLPEKPEPLLLLQLPGERLASPSQSNPDPGQFFLRGREIPRDGCRNRLLGGGIEGHSDRKLVEQLANLREVARRDRDLEREIFVELCRSAE